MAVQVIDPSKVIIDPLPPSRSAQLEPIDPRKVIVDPIKGGVSEDTYIGREGFKLNSDTNAGGLIPPSDLSPEAKLEYLKEYFKNPKVQQDLKNIGNIATTVGSLALPGIKTAQSAPTLLKLLAPLLTGGYQGAVAGTAHQLVNTGKINPLTTAIDAAIGAGVGGALTGAGKIWEGVVPWVSGINEGTMKTATTPGSKAFDVLKQIKANKGVEPIYNDLQETIRKEFNQELLNREASLGGAVGAAKETLPTGVLIQPDTADAARTFMTTINDPNFTENALSKNLQQILIEAQHGITPKRGQKLLDQLDAIAEYDKDLSGSSPFTKGLVSSIRKLRSSINKELTELTEPYKTAKTEYANNATKQAAVNRLEPIYPNQPETEELAKGQLSQFNDALKGGISRELFNQLFPETGKKYLQFGEDINAAKTLYESLHPPSIPISTSNVIGQALTLGPRYATVNWILPSRLEATTNLNDPSWHYKIYRLLKNLSVRGKNLSVTGAVKSYNPDGSIPANNYRQGGQ